MQRVFDLGGLCNARPGVCLYRWSSRYASCGGRVGLARADEADRVDERARGRGVLECDLEAAVLLPHEQCSSEVAESVNEALHTHEDIRI